MHTWLLFFVCALAILVSGTQLSRYGDIIAEKSGMGRTWMGLIVLAVITSLPELFGGISAIVIHDLPDIAVGSVLGSCMFNLLILSILDVLAGASPVSNKVHKSHIVSGALGIVMLTFCALNMVVGEHALRIGWIDGLTFVFVGMYFLSIRLIYLYDSKRVEQFVGAKAEEAQASSPGMTKTVAWFVVHALVIIVAAVFLPDIGDDLAKQHGLANSFVGNSFVAIATALPELVIAISAIRLGAFDMAVGNLFGSNLFNILILSIEDMCYKHGSLLAHVSQSQMISALASISMTAIALVGLTYRVDKKAFFMGWDAMAMAAIYVVSTYLLFILS